MGTKKIAVGCFIGGAFCSATALLFAPAFWWLGLLAGFAGGYVSYEFREVRLAVPKALREAGRGLGGGFEQLFQGIARFFAEDHPFGYLAIGLNLSVTIWGYGFTVSGRHVLAWVFAGIGNFSTFFFLGGALFCLTSMVLVTVFLLFADRGAADEKCIWTRDPKQVSGEDEQGWRRVMLSYSNAYLWLVKGIGDLIAFLAWRIWKRAAISIYIALKFTCRFAWLLFKLIHSEKRVLCGVDGVLGGFASHIWLGPSAQTFVAHVMLILFGGLLAAAFGVLTWEIISKRILHVQDAPSA